MKREDLIKLNVAEDVVDKIMALHGADIEGHKTKLAATQTELDCGGPKRLDTFWANYRETCRCMSKCI